MFNLIAHRGWPTRFTENTLESVVAAVNAGALFVEIDVQLTADGVPVLLHDETLERTAGVAGCVLDLTLDQVLTLDPRVPRLADVAAVVSGITLFVEIKPRSLERFGVDEVTGAVIAALGDAAAGCVIISFVPAALEAARRRGIDRVGWVLPDWSDEILAAAEHLAPQWLFCDHRRLPPGETPLPRGSWRWAVYEVTDAGHARELAARGVDLVETMAFGELADALR